MKKKVRFCIFLNKIYFIPKWDKISKDYKNLLIKKKKKIIYKFTKYVLLIIFLVIIYKYIYK